MPTKRKPKVLAEYIRYASKPFKNLFHWKETAVYYAGMRPDPVQRVRVTVSEIPKKGASK